MFSRVPKLRALAAAAAGVALLGVATPSSAATAPAAPTALTATFVSGGVVVSWTDNAVDETAYSVERCLGSVCTAFGQIGTVGANIVTFKDTFHAAGSSSYRVRAVNAAGSSAPSNTADVGIFSTNEVFPKIATTTTAGTVPFTATFDGSASTTLNGTPGAYDWSFGDGQTAAGAVVSHVFTSPGTYAVSLRVTATPFNSRDTTAVIVTVTAPPLVAPSALTASTAVRGQVRLAWTNPAVTSTTALALERCKGSTCTTFTRLASLTTATATFTDTTARKGSVYRYRLAASDATATVYSNVVGVTAR